MDIEALINQIRAFFNGSGGEVEDTASVPDTEVTEAPASVVEASPEGEPDVEIPGGEESLIEVPVEAEVDIDSPAEEAVEMSIEEALTKISELEAANEILRTQIESYTTAPEDSDPFSDSLFEEDSEEVDSDELDMIDDFSSKF